MDSSFLFSEEANPVSVPSLDAEIALIGRKTPSLNPRKVQREKAVLLTLSELSTNTFFLRNKTFKNVHQGVQ